MLSKKIFFIMVVCSLTLSYVPGQAQDARIPKVVPPAPDAAAFQRYGDIPISPYTGAPNISMPLYEVKSGDISVPISLSYNASGIKVADEASRVGLGWVLNAGGAISRSIIGKDDWDDYQSQTFGDIPLGPKYDQGNGFNYIFNCLQSINGYSLPQVLLNNQNSDFQPDQYSYNFNGHSGKFILRRNKSVLLNKIDKIDIRLTDTVNATSWEIKTADGFRYVFNDIESYVDYPVNRKSSWYLSKIISPSGRTVQFQYTDISLDMQPAGSYFESQAIGFLASGLCTPPSPPSNYSNNVSGHTYHSLYLSKIISDQCEVQFVYSPGRLDITNDVQLDSIKVYSKKYGDAVNTLIKSWNLTYSYFKGTYIYGISNATDTNQLYKRLKLVSLKESSPSASLPPYNFSYNNDSDANSILPAKLCFARDHWGYFNGKFSNASLIPTFYGGGGGTVNPGVMGSERNADPNYSQLFILNKIKYPTGGYTTFQYESNDFDVTNSVVNDHSFFGSYIAAIPVAVQSGFSNIQAGGNFSGTLDLRNMYPSGQYATLQAYFIKTSGLDVATVNQITYSLKDSSGGVIGSGYTGLYLGSTSPPKTEWLGTQSSNSGVIMTLIEGLTPQVYTWSFYVPAGVTAANVVINYTKGESYDPIVSSGDIVYNALFGGGLRIKKITDSIDASTPVKIRKYNYHYLSNGRQYSYGRRMAKPNYSYYEMVPACSGSLACLFRESDSNIPLNGSTNGVAVGYDQVEEFFGENGENGKNIYRYWNQPDQILDYRVTIGDPLATIPLKPPYGGIIPDAGNGNLIKQTTYSNINGQFVKNKEDSCKYLDLSDFYHSVVYGIDKRVVGSQSVPGMDCGMLSFYTYPSLTVNRPVLTFSISKIYDATGAIGPVTTTTEYTYDTSTHLQVTSQSVYKSTGDKVTTNYKYPADYADAQCDSALLQMKGTAYMHALPVTQQTFITRGTDKLLTNAMINKYQLTGGKIFHKEIAALETTQAININTPPTAYNPSAGSYPSGYAAKVFFDSYDTVGNILQVHKASDINMSYIWDYYLNYPVAEITNATTTNCAFSSFESDSKGNWSFSGSASTDSLAPTGTRCYSLSGGSVSKSGLSSSGNYIVSYWSKNGQQTVSNSGTATTGRTLGSWTYYEHPVANPSGGTITVSGSGIIDELRLYPKGAFMTTLTYKPLIGTTTQCDANNRIVYYEYDSFGRLTLVRDQDQKIIKKICYNYAGQPENCSSPYFENVQKSGTYTRNNCGTGYVAGSVTYIVPAGAYNSPSGQVYVDSLAQADVYANGQAYANANGACTCNAEVCTAPSHQCIHSICETGTPYCVSSVFNRQSNLWTNTYKYFFSDCSNVFGYTTTSSASVHPSTPCP